MISFLQVELAMAYGCDVSQKQLLHYIHFNRHHNTMLINKLATEIETLKVHQNTPVAVSSHLGVTLSGSDPVVMLRRKEAGNPVDFFDKTFAEYQKGFEANGEFEQNRQRINIFLR